MRDDVLHERRTTDGGAEDAESLDEPGAVRRAARRDARYIAPKNAIGCHTSAAIESPDESKV
jgi:hypothetical protein